MYWLQKQSLSQKLLCMQAISKQYKKIPHEIFSLFMQKMTEAWQKSEVAIKSVDMSNKFICNIIDYIISI